MSPPSWFVRGSSQDSSGVLTLSSQTPSTAGSHSQYPALPEFLARARASGLQPGAMIITSDADLTAVPFEACLNGELRLDPYVNALVAVISADRANKTAVLLAADTISDPLLKSVVEMLKKRGIALLSNAPNCHQAGRPVITALVNGDLQPKHMRVTREVSGNADQSALWLSFVSIVQWAVEHRANDLDFRIDLGSATSAVFFKIDGQYLTLDRWKMPSSTLVAMLSIAYQKSNGGADTKFEPRQEQQCRIDITLPPATRLRLRWASMSTDSGCVVTMRIQRMGSAQTILTLEDAGFMPDQIEAFNRAVTGKGGLTTFAGTVGSGKSVTLAILMRMISKALKGVSIEDPVEIEIAHMIQKTVTRDLLSDDDRAFQAAVVTLFRSALDYLVMGEVRDVATGRVVRAILESGHSCFTTTHAASGLGIFTKFVSPQVGIPLDVLATPGMLRLNIYQALLPKLCGCSLNAAAYQDSLTSQEDRREHAVLRDDIHNLFGLDPNILRYRNAQGCTVCKSGQQELPSFWGLTGRVVVAEMVEPDEHMCELLQRADMVGLSRYWRSMSDGDVTSLNTAGKTAIEVAMHKAAKGQIDPYTVQSHLESFRTLASKKAAKSRMHDLDQTRQGPALSVLAGGMA